MQHFSPDHARNPLTRLQKFAVDYEFPVVFTRRLFRPGNPALLQVLGDAAQAQRLLIFVDSGVMAARPALPGEIASFVASHPLQVELAAPPIVMDGGEGVKQGLTHVLDMQQAMVEHGIDRHSYVVAIGGGAFLDAVGLAAATAHRGIRHIRVPTTVLSQNDSGVGVKNGVNLHGAKNYFGTFAPPFAVLNDLDFIDILPDREKRAGMAEAVKVALIRDRAFFEWLESAAGDLAAFHPDAMDYMIRRCAELHMHQIGQGGDPFERGTARPLDFGHWAAHRLEIMSGFTLRHGEAVAIGMALDCLYAVRVGLLRRPQADRALALLRALGFTLEHPLLANTDVLMAGLVEFQEHLGGELTITLLKAIGKGVEVHHIDHAAMIAAAHDLAGGAA
ncbi:3-dehydroquinate synthase [Ketogulonicigenium vulgare]|uniref:3-dehydroquinate synthase domain protein n=1 Tax=Ketogulonicigenium vulgare (strain WSH-001) TaxID=759362 RepID=F9YB68_KETVW|nr:3-dehydroquinate synthase [Ketogulonicigenium vulgare]ADO44096.1 3-dehydroquinate synthase [Ketogulonicigenium vulgare Y25]AEM42620.1 3-dehydroquinate synthase domain protein [Ketogulonicigenium vulgare WSH-001]ALJ82644.1 3-dehydroquinate synthase [Ketogulonicigenium vulgare]ANW35399.1 3-dehydroquinate synthase [Ketogulonicigenium vulgare]AOZ53322.1 3-dehydroquinate synthase [Ketogulonicigenium vulgare]